MQSNERAAMRRSGRPGALGRLFHDLRQPLTATTLDVATAIQLIRQDAPDDALGALEDALAGLKRMERRLTAIERSATDETAR